MITHASTTFEWRRSFSDHVEMYSRGSKCRGWRSSFTTCWRRMGPGSKGRRRKNLPASRALARGHQAHDRAESDEQEREEPDREGVLGGHVDSEVHREHRGGL